MPLTGGSSGTDPRVLKGIEELLRKQWVGMLALILSILALIIAWLK